MTLGFQISNFRFLDFLLIYRISSHCDLDREFFSVFVVINCLQLKKDKNVYVLREKYKLKYYYNDCELDHEVHWYNANLKIKDKNICTLKLGN